MGTGQSLSSFSKGCRRHLDWEPLKLFDWLAHRHPDIVDWPAVSTAGDFVIHHGLVQGVLINEAGVAILIDRVHVGTGLRFLLMASVSEPSKPPGMI